MLSRCAYELHIKAALPFQMEISVWMRSSCGYILQINISSVHSWVPRLVALRETKKTITRTYRHSRRQINLTSERLVLTRQLTLTAFGNTSRVGRIRLERVMCKTKLFTWTKKVWISWICVSETWSYNFWSKWWNEISTWLTEHVRWFGVALPIVSFGVTRETSYCTQIW